MKGNKNKIFIFLIGVTIGMGVLLIPMDGHKESDNQVKIDSLENILEKKKEERIGLNNYIQILEDSIIKKEHIESLKDSIIEQLKKRGRAQVVKIKELEKDEADLLLEEKFPNEETRSKEILTELAEGDMAKEVLVETEKKLEVIKGKEIEFKNLIQAKDILISNLEYSLETSEEKAELYKEDYEKAKKEIKKHKRKMRTTQIVAGIAVVFALII